MDSYSIIINDSHKKQHYHEWVQNDS